MNIATTCRECPAECGMHVRHRDSCIIKCVGNPHHPINKDGLCPRGQSAPQGLHDQDRITTPYYNQNFPLAALGFAVPSLLSLIALWIWRSYWEPWGKFEYPQGRWYSPTLVLTTTTLYNST